MPEVPDTETSFADLRHRIDKAPMFIASVGMAAAAGVELKFNNEMARRSLNSDGPFHLAGCVSP